MAVVLSETYFFIFKIFQRFLEDRSSPMIYAKQLFLQISENHKILYKVLQNVLLEVLPNYTKNAQSLQLIQLLKTFFSEIKYKISVLQNFFENTNILISEILKLLIEGTESKNNSCRVGSVMLINHIFSLDLHETFLISLSIQSSFTTKLPKLLRDKSSSIRGFSIKIAKKLQISSEFFEVCLGDPIKKNRKAAVRELNLDPKKISEKLVDDDHEVRFEALKKLISFGITGLDVKIRREILLGSIKERYGPMREFAMSSLKNIISQIGIEALLELAEMDSMNRKQQLEMHIFITALCGTFEVSELETLISEISLQKVLEKTDDFKGLLLASVSIETLFIKSESTLHKLLPSESLISLLTYYHPSCPFIFSQSLLKICSYLETQEEWIRKSLISSLIALCLNYNISIIPNKKISTNENSFFKLSSEYFFADNSLDILKIAVEMLRNLLDQHYYEFPRIMGEILNEIRDPLAHGEENESDSLLGKEKKLHQKIAMIDFEIEALEDDKANMIQANDFVNVFSINREIKNKANFAQVLEEELGEVESEIISRRYRALAITTEMLREIKYGVMILDISEFVKNLVIPALKIDQEPVQIVAFECLTQCCLHDFQICKENLHLYKIVLQKFTDSNLEFTVLLSVIDFYLTWEFDCNYSDFDLFSDEILKLILRYTQSANEFIQAIAVEGLSKLVILGRVKSPIILAYLMVPYFDLNSSTIVKQILQVFFNKFNKIVLEHCENLVEGFKMVLSLLCWHLEKNEVLEVIDFSYFSIKKIFSFIWSCLSKDSVEEIHKSSECNYHFDVFYYLTQEIISKSTSTRSEIYSRLLLQIDIFQFSAEELSVCKKILQKASKVLNTSFLPTILEKIPANLKKPSEAFEASLLSKYMRTVHLVSIFLSNYTTSLIPNFSHNNLKRKLPITSDKNSKKIKLNPH